MTVCACMGPQNGEQYCPCRMQSMGLRTAEDYKMSQEQSKRLKEVLNEWLGKPPTRLDDQYSELKTRHNETTIHSSDVKMVTPYISQEQFDRVFPLIEKDSK